jgi:hypothetical protein
MTRKSGHRRSEKTTLDQKDKARLRRNLSRSGLMVAEPRTILAEDHREETRPEDLDRLAAARLAFIDTECSLLN